MSVQIKLAKIARIITVTPVIALLLFLSLMLFKPGTLSWFDFCILTAFTVVFPSLSYIVSAVVPKFRAGGRDTQRKIAFVFSIVGYIIALVIELNNSRTFNTLLICIAYLGSVIILTLVNKLIKIKASGHSCGITGNLIIACWYYQWVGFIICVILFALGFWCSLVTKRHTKKEFILGAACSAMACVIAGVICFACFK